MVRPLPRRTFLGVLGAGALASLGTAACGNGAGAGDEPLELWALQDPVLREVYQGAIRRHAKQADASTLELSQFQPDAYLDKLNVAMRSPNQPDIFFNWGGGSIRNYVESDLLVDLTPTLDSNPDLRNAFLPAVLDAGKIGDKYYGIPNRGMQPVVLFYNTRVFDQVGEEPPTTWEETLQLVDKLTGEGITPFTLAGAQSWTELMWFEYFVDRIGGPEVFRAVAAGEQGAWRQPAITQALDEIATLIERGGFASNFSSVDWETGAASALFAKDKAAMHLMGTWEYTNQLDQNPEFAKDGLAFTTFPAYEGGAGDPKAVVGNPTNYFSISKRSNDVDAAIAFLNQMTTDKYVQHFSEKGDILALEGIESDLEAHHPNPEFAGFVYEMVAAAPTFQLSWDQDVDRKYAQPMVDALQKFFLGDLDSKGYVAEMEALP